MPNAAIHFVAMFMLVGGAALAGPPEAEEQSRPNDAAEAPYDRARVGDINPDRIVLPTNQTLTPAGTQAIFAGRPTDLAISPDGRRIAVLNRSNVVVLDAEKGEVLQTVKYPTKKAGGAYKGIVYSPDGSRLYASSIHGQIEVFGVDEAGRLTGREPIVPLAHRHGNALPAGLAITPDGARLYATLNLNDTLAEIDCGTGKVLREIEVGSAPFDVAIRGNRAYVSNFGGRRPAPGDATVTAGNGSPIRSGPNGYSALEGSVSVVDLDSGTVVREVPLPPHASGVCVSGAGVVFVACSGGDAVIALDADTGDIIETIAARLSGATLPGSAPNALALSPDGATMYIALGAANAVAVVELGSSARKAASASGAASRVLGLIPTGWYPGAVAVDARRGRLVVANVKGVGSRDRAWEGKRKIEGKVVSGYNSHDHLGSVSLVPIPDAPALARMTEMVAENDRAAVAAAAVLPARPEQPARPVPERAGEPSVFKHIIYIIKENRTYDQVFGDIKKGNGDPSLCIFGESITPNHHRLADEFVLLDNFSCSGVLSADGHHWASEAYASEYLEKSFAEFVRSYPCPGGDALSSGPGGYIWDSALAHKKKVRIYGEGTDPDLRWADSGKKGEPAFLDYYRDFLDGTHKTTVKTRFEVPTIEPYTCASFAGFQAKYPDVARAAVFIDELHEFERMGEMPDLSIVWLCNDHTSGTTPGNPTPQAALADNDLALGRVVDAVSHSKFWPQTCIMVVQDDPQNGFDHVDGHRTVAMCISPYTRRGSVDSTNYNQTSMIRTMGLILGFPPVNQIEAAATPMVNCFQSQPDFRPYAALPNTVPLDQVNPPLSEITDPVQRDFAERSLALDFDEEDRADEDGLNRILWWCCRGDSPYPDWAVDAEIDDQDDE